MVAGIPGHGGGPPVSASGGQPGRSYSSLFAATSSSSSSSSSGMQSSSSSGPPSSGSFASCTGLMSSVGHSSGRSKEETYWFCRRSLRLWPVAGSDLKKALGAFLKTRLKLDNSFLMDMGDVSVKKMAAGPRSKISGEVIAVFSTVAIRDTVRSMARELAGDPDAGVRLEIPYSLQPNLKALESVSYNLKTVSYTHLTLPTIYSV